MVQVCLVALEWKRQFMFASDSPPAKFLESSYNWRSLWNVLFFILFAGVTGFLIVHLIHDREKITFERDQIGGLAVTSVMIIGFTFFAAAQMWMRILRRRGPSVIDERGVSVGSETIEWDKIGLVFPMVATSGLRGATRWIVGFQLCGSSFLVGRRPVPGHNLTRAEYEKFAQDLEACLAESSSHVRVEHIS